MDPPPPPARDMEKMSPLFPLFQAILKVNPLHIGTGRGREEVVGGELRGTAFQEPPCLPSASCTFGRPSVGSSSRGNLGHLVRKKWHHPLFSAHLLLYISEDETCSLATLIWGNLSTTWPEDTRQSNQIIKFQTKSWNFGHPWIISVKQIPLLFVLIFHKVSYRFL